MAPPSRMERAQRSRIAANMSNMAALIFKNIRRLATLGIPFHCRRRQRGSGGGKPGVSASLRAQHAEGQEDYGHARRQRGVSSGDLQLLRGDRQGFWDRGGSGRGGEGGDRRHSRKRVE